MAAGRLLWFGGDLQTSQTIPGVIAVSERDFQIEVIQGLTELKTDMRSVKEHLAKLNGKVAAHERGIGEMKIHLAERQNQCPIAVELEARVRPVEDFVTAERRTFR
jgi:hypothetical protein